MSKKTKVYYAIHSFLISAILASHSSIAEVICLFQEAHQAWSDGFCAQNILANEYHISWSHAVKVLQRLSDKSFLVFLFFFNVFWSSFKSDIICIKQKLAYKLTSQLSENNPILLRNNNPFCSKHKHFNISSYSILLFRMVQSMFCICNSNNSRQHNTTISIFSY